MWHTLHLVDLVLEKLLNIIRTKACLFPTFESRTAINIVPDTICRLAGSFLEVDICVIADSRVSSPPLRQSRIAIGDEIFP